MDRNNSSSGNKSIIIIIALLLVLITFSGIAFFSTRGIVHIEKLGIINTISFFGFIVLCVLSFVSERIYFLLLPFILLAYPAAANDFFPSVFLGENFEDGASLFPFFTHIDIYLTLGVIKTVVARQGKVEIYSNNLVTGIILLFFLSTIVNCFFVKDTHAFALLICGLFPLRYIILLLILISNYEIKKYQIEIISSLVFSVFFLLLESSLNSYVSKTDMLVSGTLAANTFANIISAIVILIIYLKRNDYPIKYYLYLAALMGGISIILLTETRMAILAGVVSFFIIQMKLYKWYRTFLVLLTLGVCVVIIYNMIDVPDRYSVKVIMSRVEYNGFSKDITKMFSVERSWETNSLISRLQLYQTSLNMLFENPVFGVGYGTFNYLKNDFGFDEMVLIDAHNGYLNTLSQMGFSSMFFLYFIYLYPIFNYSVISDSKNWLKFLFILNTTMAIADLSNAGVYKPSVFALLAFSSFVIMKIKNESANVYS